MIQLLAFISHRGWEGVVSLLINFMDHVLTLKLDFFKQQGLGKWLPAQMKTVPGRFECRRLQRFFEQHGFPPFQYWSAPLIWRGAGANGIGFGDEAMRHKHLIIAGSIAKTEDKRQQIPRT